MNQWGKVYLFSLLKMVLLTSLTSIVYRSLVVSHLRQITKAIDNGAKIIGYLHWSFMDNYEWFDHYRPEAKFALFYVDRDDNDDYYDSLNLKRKITKGAEAYKLIIKESVNQSKCGTVTDLQYQRQNIDLGAFLLMVLIYIYS
jgi:hypothetical protein